MKWFFAICLAATSSVTSVYHSLDPNSIREHIAFHALYPDTDEGIHAYEKAHQLLQKHAPSGTALPKGVQLPPLSLSHLLSLTHIFPEEHEAALSQTELYALDTICSHFKNRTLKGHTLTDHTKIDALQSNEIDLARSILLLEYKDEPHKMEKIRSYEAMLDSMALEIMAHVEPNASRIDIVHAMNDFIFHVMNFRFPPHSLWAKDIDEYTLLPSVMDSRQGVCLGVSILYLSLAQRIGLPLEIVTPPGHIYVRLRDRGETTVIETTARGISLPEDTYLSVNTKSLKTRTMKEVVGLAFFNQASVAWRKNDYEAAKRGYLTAKRFVPDDSLIDELLGFSYILSGDIKNGEKHLSLARNNPPQDVLFRNALLDDYFAKNISLDGIKAIFKEVDESRSSILAKRDELKALLSKNPKSKELAFHLAITYLQLGRGKEAKDLLHRYIQLEKHNPTAYYYLAIISMERYDYPSAWRYIEQCEALTTSHNHTAKVIESLKTRLQHTFPKPAKTFL